MKKIKFVSLLILMLGLLLASCNRDITEPVISSNPTKSTLSDMSFPGQFNVNYADSLMTFSWSTADFGFPASITYIVQVSPTQDFSKNVSALFTTQTLSGTAKVSDVNTLILSWNYAIGTSATVYYRVAATVSPNVDTVFSAVKSTSLIPYDAVINYPMVYVPGDYQGWAPDKAADTYSLLYSYGFNSTYTSIIRLVNTSGSQTNFKVTSNPDWNHTNYGFATLIKTGNDYSGTCSTNSSAGNFTVDNGVYVLTIDVNALTISLTKTDDWGIIGSSIPPYDWSADVNMNYNGQRKMWEITGDFKAGEFKFRANNDWTLNYGDDGNKNGGLKAGGDNIALSADGNYTIRFDPVKLTYKIIKN
ncbi:MAG: SusE domain-containing protein [Ignavibacteriaceae bacterium]